MEKNAYQETVTTAVAAIIVGLAKSTLETMRTRGGGPVFLKLGRAVRYDIEDLKAWRAERRRTSTAAFAAPCAA